MPRALRNPARLVGVISDTHGLLRPQALAALRGCDHIIHAGDIGDVNILEQLARLAPVTAVRGNNDRDGRFAKVPLLASVVVAGIAIRVIHILPDLLPDELAGHCVVISGHSHKPLIETRSDVLYVNPGSAGPRRFKLPVSVALLRIAGEVPGAELITLDPD